MNKILSVCICFFLSLSLCSQNTVGLISYKKDKSFDGYNLVFPHNQSTVYLINNCGEIVHTWSDSTNWRPGNTVYLTKEGKLIKCKRDANVTQDKIWAGGGGAIVEIRDWNNNLEWSFMINDSLNRLHHDIAPMPNGNILMIMWNKKNKVDLIAAGRDSILHNEEFLLSETVIEVDPKLNKIVWRWDLWDHLIQDNDPSKPKYGIVKDNPHKINFNYQYRKNEGSWFHLNSIDYNQELDQIILSSPVWDEMWIIDHTTTTVQAAGSTGGFANKGGDLIFRWGNSRTYNKSEVFSQTLFFQHDVQWVNDFIRNDHPLKGSILAFNNQTAIDYSSVNFILPPWDMYEWNYTKTNGAWGPLSYKKTVTHPQKTKLFSPRQSSVQLLPNDNMLIFSGMQGYAFEVTPDEKVVWEYIIPFKNGKAINQNTTLALNDNTTFRFKRYPPTYTAFLGKNLSPKGFIELTPNIGYCNKLVSNEDINLSADIRLFPNPASDLVNVFVATPTDATILTSDGIKIKDLFLDSGKNEVFISDLKAGLYFITTENGIIKAFSVVR